MDKDLERLLDVYVYGVNSFDNYEFCNEINDLKSKNEKLQKVIDVIRKQYCLHPDFFCNECGFDVNKLKSILSEVEG